MDVPDIQYTRSGDVAIAYQVLGEGPVDVVWFRGMAGDLLSTWDQPLIVRHAVGLAAFSRVLGFDKRGTGLSDRVREAATLETRMDDVRAVMDAAGSERAVLWTAHEGSRTALLFAATYPERTAGLVLLEPSVRGTGSSDYPWAPSEEEWRQRLASVREGWGQRRFFAELLREWAPSLAHDDAFKEWFVGHMRRSLSPGAALSFFRTMKDADVSDILSSVSVPTLILCKPDQRPEAEYVARRIAGSELAELPGLDGLFTWVDDDVHEQTMRESERFHAHRQAPRARSGSGDGAVYRHRGLDNACSGARERGMAHSFGAPSCGRPPPAGPVPRRRDRHCGGRLLRRIRWPSPRDRVCSRAGRGRAIDRARDPCRSPHRRVRADGDEAERNRRSDRSPGGGAGRTGRGAGLQHREGSRRRLGAHIR